MAAQAGTEQGQPVIFFLAGNEGHWATNALFLCRKESANMSREMKRPIITVNRVFEGERSAMEAFVAVLVGEIERRSVRTFESVKEPEYTGLESEVVQDDADA